MMEGSDVTIIRNALETAVGHRVSLQEMGEAMGLAPANANRAMREWEGGGPTGPGAAALTYLAQGLGLADGGADLPMYSFGDGHTFPPADTPPRFRKVVVRLWWPRFVAMVDRPSQADGEFFPVDERMELRIVQWIDDPLLFGKARQPYGTDAARHFGDWWHAR